MHTLRRAFGVLAAGAVATSLLTPGLSAQPEDRNPRVQVDYAPAMLVMDGSGSMAGGDPSGGTKIDAAKRSVNTLVRSLPDNAQLGLTTYGTGTGNSPAEKERGCRDVSVRQQVRQLDRDALSSAVGEVEPSGYTPIGHALRTAADELPSDGQRAIVLVSDGLDTCAPPDPCEIAERLGADGVDTVVHAVGYGVDDPASEQLNCIAEATGGTYTEAPDAKALEEALPKVTTVALRDYEPVGTPANGTAGPRSAPALEPNQYRDELGPEGKKFYAVDVPPGATGYFSATVPFARTKARTSDVDVVEVRATAPDGTECRAATERELATRSGDGEALTSSTVLDTSEGGEDDSCARGGRYTMSIERESGESQQQRLPVEIQVGVEPKVAGDEGPPAATDPADFQEPVGAAQPVIGGGSFSTAPELDGSGVYRDSLAHGEYVFYRVRLDWGQGLAYRVRYKDNENAETVNVATELLSPYRAVIDDDTGAYTGSATMLSGSHDAIATWPVRYRNRDGDGDQATQAVPGEYYIAVKLGKGNSGDPPATTVDAEIELSVTGEPEQGPQYAAGPSAGDGSDIFGQRTPEPATDIRSSDSGRSAFPFVPVLSTVGGVVLLGAGVLTGYLVSRRNRRRFGL